MGACAAIDEPATAVARAYHKIATLSSAASRQFDHFPDAASLNVGKIAVLGSGAFGTAAASVIASSVAAPSSVVMTCRKEDQADTLTLNKRNPKSFSEENLGKNVCGTTCAQSAVRDASAVIVAIPVQSMAKQLRAIQQVIESSTPVINLSKGIEQGSLRVPSDIIHETLCAQQPVGVVSGPSFAHEMLEGIPTALMAASPVARVRSLAQQLFTSSTTRVVPGVSMGAVEFAAAMKNTVALATGIVEGCGYGSNALSAVVAQGAREMELVAVTMGGTIPESESVLIHGDLMLTSFFNHSRNRRLGIAIGQQGSVSLQEGENGVCEGFYTGALLN